MKCIKLSHGTIFVKHDNVTVRITKDGKCELSPIMFSVLEWDLRTENPDSWWYLYECDIRAMDNNIYQQVVNIVNDFYLAIGQESPK